MAPLFLTLLVATIAQMPPTAGAQAAKPPGASLLVNGSFEEGPALGSYVNLAGGTASITGWVVIGEGIDYVGNLWRGSDGQRSLDLDGSARSRATPPYAQGGIAQTFPTTPGTAYIVTFDMAGNPFGAPVNKPLRVTAAGQHAELTLDVAGRSARDMGWTTQIWTFTAEDSSTTLEFRSLTTAPATGFGVAIDNVSVEASLGSQAAARQAAVPAAPTAPAPARSGAAPTPALPKAGGTGIKVGDTVMINTAFGWTDAVVLAVNGHMFRVRASTGAEVSKPYPDELRRIGPLTAYDRAVGIYEVGERVQVNFEGRWVNSRILGTMGGREYQVSLPGNRTAWTTSVNLRLPPK